MPSTREIAIVTGASGGIGSAICRRLAADGYAIVGQYRSDAAAAQSLKASLEQRGAACDLVRADLAEPQGVESVVAHVRRLIERDPHARIRVLVNNAGILLGPSLQDATHDTFDRYVAVNLRAPFFLVQGLADLMDRGAGVVNISSASAHIASAGDLVYAMTKSGLESLTKNMALALAPRGIRVNAVVPGFTDNGHPAFSDEAARAYMGGLSALGGVASPEDVAAAVAFLVSDASARTTGSLLDVTGGMTLNPRPHGGASVKDVL